MSDKVQLAIVGTGGIAGAHLNGYRALLDAGYDRFEIAGLCDVNEDRRNAFAAQVKELFGTSPKHFSSVEEMVGADSGIQAADICTPHAFHHTAAIPCLEGGIHVMVEKPCGITVKANDLIIDAGKKAGRIVAVAEQVRRGLKARAMNWAINDVRMIGDVQFFNIQGFSHWDFNAENYKGAYAWQWRLLKLLTGGGMVFDAGAHFTDMMRYLFGDVDEVTCTMHTFQSVTLDSPELGPQPMDVEDTWFSTIKFVSGLVGNYSWSFSAVGESVATQIFYGSEGSARDRGGWMHPFQNGGDLQFADGSTKKYEEIEVEYRAQLDDATRDKLFPHGVENDVALECWDFVDSIDTGREPEIDGVTAKKAKCVCLALYESSAAGGKPIKVADVFDSKVSAYQAPINEYWKI